MADAVSATLAVAWIPEKSATTHLPALAPAHPTRKDPLGHAAHFWHLVSTVRVQATSSYSVPFWSGPPHSEHAVHWVVAVPTEGL